MNGEKFMRMNDLQLAEAQEMAEQFFLLYQEWLQKSPHLAVSNMINLPMCLILSTYMGDDELITRLAPDLPDFLIKAIKPVEKYKELWGKIPNHQFKELYRQEYENQFKE